MPTKRQRWNQRYQEKTLTDLSPASVLELNRHLLPASGRALEIASGLGANSIFLADAGLNVTAVDYSQVALDQLSAFAKSHQLAVKTKCIDLEQDEFVLPEADVIVVSYYLYRPLLPRLIDALSPSGLFIYQTFCGQYLGKGPENNAFRLQPGELKQVCHGLDVLYYQDNCSGLGHSKLSSEQAGEAMIVARKSIKPEMPSANRLEK